VNIKHKVVTVHITLSEKILGITSVAEPEPPGAASFGRSRNAMRLRQWYQTYLELKNETKCVNNPFSSYFQQYT
jgi:hypothetical protein